MLYDTHAHLDDAKLYPEIENVLARAAAAGVAYINTIGCDWKTSLMPVHIAEKYPEHVFAAVGVHPHEAAGLNAEQEEKLFSLAKAERWLAGGRSALTITMIFLHAISNAVFFGRRSMQQSRQGCR